ncbi:MAG TPA: bifunctional diaminohydroxyphosphoribosylaminopyrimidine deaminase/5-amino-6-(5-phosphoribosylamino)uracil reductase RibD [Chloroflexota bacterium]|nr:bifunctional diaminohydroxyphosphoribosylaminopyrimidine deaminase/5-amino-6-(5-phosphoribosylamino)uracil reductase RibD [Chloroflexota bacterium]
MDDTADIPGAADAAAMARAVALGESGRRTSAPNPWVGCVLVRRGAVVGEGFHRAAGEPHAEALALRAAGERAQGATAYVTLEPCAHHGRTPPCADALVAAGIERVVVAVLDPDPRVAGRGVARLRAAGVSVEVGVGSDEVGRSLAPYLHQRRTGRPYCVLKAAVSLDGRTAAADGSSRWITGPAARGDAHALRAASQAVVVGAGTALADAPSLTVRDAPEPRDRQPLRVLLDTRGRVPASGPLFDTDLAPTLVVTTERADPQIVAAWRAAGAEVARVSPAAGGRGVDLSAALALLADRGVLQALVEGGATLHGALFAAALADRLVLYVGGCLLGERGRPLAVWPGPETIGAAPRWRLAGVCELGGDARLDYEPVPEAAHQAAPGPLREAA